MIEFIDVSYSYPHLGSKEISVLESLSFSAQSSNIISIVGPSGSGKSTILKLISGLIQPTFGQILIDGKPTEQCRKEGLFGLVFQNPALLPWRTVEDNVQLPLELRKGIIDTKIVKAILKKVGLEFWNQKFPHQLSGGMQQRVALARALVASPRLLLLDEPFSQLDEILRFDLLFQIIEYAKINKSGVILVTHDISEAVLASDAIFILLENPVTRLDYLSIPLPHPRSLETSNHKQYAEIVSFIRKKLRKNKINA